MKIMLVDDEQIILTGMTRLVQKIVPDAELNTFSNPLKAIEFLQENTADVAILDIEMPGMKGIDLALHCKMRCPQINIIFATGYSEYAANAFQLRASGYLLKPVNEQALRQELENLRNPLTEEKEQETKLLIQTFGNFEVFVEGKPIQFSRSRSKEALAYLVDRQGAAVKNRELASILWEDKEYDIKLSKNLFQVMHDLEKDLKKAGISSIFGKRRGEYFIVKQNVVCDYYQMLDQDVQALNKFRGEYMSQYSWGEYTLGSLLEDSMHW